MRSGAEQEVASRAPVVLVQPEVHADAAEDAEILQASIRAGSVAQIVVAVIAVIGLIYLLKLVLVTALASLLLAFVLEPLVGGLARIRLPRALGALLAVVMMVGLSGGLTYFFYGRAVDFATQLPKYSGKLRSSLAVLREQTRQIEESTRSSDRFTQSGQSAPRRRSSRSTRSLEGNLGGWRNSRRSVSGGHFRSLSGLFHAYVEGSRTLHHCATLPQGTPTGCIPHGRQDLGNDPRFYCWQCLDRTH